MRLPEWPPPGRLQLPKNSELVNTAAVGFIDIYADLCDLIVSVDKPAKLF